jgi:2-keto-4-pentenoate hydratase/2-oxohepta-3-ene-1,7-dioic acid hydratase in catechol pathway
MKLAMLKTGRAAIVQDTQVVMLDDLGFPMSVLKLIQSGPDVLEDVRSALEGTPGDPLDRTSLASPMHRPPKIVAVGLNYRDHAEESGLGIPSVPVIFSKFPSTITGPYDDVRAHGKLTQCLDYEVELGIVIGKIARDVTVDAALDHVFGYTILNDVSARDLQMGSDTSGQWTRGKNLDTSLPMGPWIVTKDELPDPGHLRLGCAVNGQTLQDASTESMIFSVPEIISRLSSWFTLEPGDVIITGTPAGVGFVRKPPIFLKPGDVMRTWIEGIGELENKVVA